MVTKDLQSQHLDRIPSRQERKNKTMKAVEEELKKTKFIGCRPTLSFDLNESK